MRKIIVLTLILFLLSSVVSAQDLTGDQPTLINIGGVLVNQLDIGAPFLLNTGEAKVIATATAPSSPTDTGYVEGATSYEANIKIYGPDGQGNYVEVQNNFVSAAPGQTYSFTVTVNEVEMTGDSQQIIIPDGETKTFYAYSPTLNPNNYVELIVTNPAESVVSEPATSTSGGSRIYTPEEEQKIDEAVEKIGSLSLTLTQEIIKGALKLRLEQGEDVESVNRNILELYVARAINQDSVFSPFADTIYGASGDDLVPSAPKTKPQTIRKWIYDPHEGPAPEPQQPPVPIPPPLKCYCDYGASVFFFCETNSGSEEDDNAWFESFRRSLGTKPGVALPWAPTSGYSVVVQDETEQLGVSEGTVKEGNIIMPNGVTSQTGYCSYSISDVADGECDSEEPTSKALCILACRRMERDTVGGALQKCLDEKSKQCEGSFSYDASYNGLDSEGNPDPDSNKGSIEGECR